MTARNGIRYRLTRRLVHGARTVQSTLSHFDGRIDTWVGAFLNATLSTEEKEALSVELYDQAFNPDKDFDGLYEWEERWFARRLPTPPARVLVGAAGAGREAKVLEQRGYAVHAFDPSARAFAYCRQRLGAESTVVRASYGDVVRAVLEGAQTGLEFPENVAFDAVLLGWGSFGHVLNVNDRYRLLRACDKLAPAGPILLSIFEPGRRRAPRKAPQQQTDAPSFVSWGGFLVEPSVEELAEHSGKLGRELIGALDAPSPYFTLAPRPLSTDVSANEHSPQSETRENALRR